MKVQEILAKAKIKEFDSRTIGFLEKKDFLELWKIREKEIEELKKAGMSENEAKKHAFKDSFKIINPLPLPIKIINFGYGIGYMLIKDKEKIKARVEKDWAIWVNKMRKNAKILAKKETSEKERKKIIDKFEVQIKEAEKYYLMIKEERVDEVIVSNFEFINELYKPMIYIKYLNEKKESKTKTIYLRKDVINVVYEDDIFIPKKSKAKIDKKLKEMKNVFGYYYIKNK